MKKSSQRTAAHDGEIPEDPWTNKQPPRIQKWPNPQVMHFHQVPHNGPPHQVKPHVCRNRKLVCVWNAVSFLATCMKTFKYPNLEGNRNVLLEALIPLRSDKNVLVPLLNCTAPAATRLECAAPTSCRSGKAGPWPSPISSPWLPSGRPFLAICRAYHGRSNTQGGHQARFSGTPLRDPLFGTLICLNMGNPAKGFPFCFPLNPKKSYSHKETHQSAGPPSSDASNDCQPPGPHTNQLNPHCASLCFKGMLVLLMIWAMAGK